MPNRRLSQFANLDENITSPIHSLLQANSVDNITTYLLLYHEAAVANLLEICLFHSSALEAIDEDHLIELVDWCYRKVREGRGGKWLRVKSDGMG